MVIFEQIVNYPHVLKYRMLNVKNLSNIVDNCALSLDLLITFGFIYTSNKSQLSFYGGPQYLTHAFKINLLVSLRKVRRTLSQLALRACFAADKYIR